MKKDIIIKFGKQIQKIRLNKGYSQEKLAQLSKVHRTYIGMIERGEKNITLKNIEKISKALEISISDLFQKLE